MGHNNNSIRWPKLSYWCILILKHGLMNYLPLITICELHVHCMTAEEGLGVQRELNVGRVRDGVTDQNQVWDSRLLLPIGTRLSVVLINTHVS